MFEVSNNTLGVGFNYRDIIMVYLRSFLVFSFVTLSGCGDSSTQVTSDGDILVCTPSIEAGIKIAVFDKETGVPISCGATATLSEGDFFETLDNPDSPDCFDTVELIGASERAGIYQVEVSKSGYLLWQQQDVQVSANLCHVNTISLQVYLEKI